MDGMMMDLGTTRMMARVEGAVGWMVFNNPERRNAVSLDMWEAIPVILDRFAADPAIRVIALTGAGGRAFVSGADISQFEKERSTPDQIAHYEHRTHAAHVAITQAGKPTVAVIRGWCIGGGLAIAANCDLRFATVESKFGIPAGRLGLGYGHEGVKTLMDIVGPAYTKEIFYTARHFSAPPRPSRWASSTAWCRMPSWTSFAAAQCAAIAANAPMTLATR